MTDGARYELISADSHLIEPPDLFESRLPVSLRGRAPKLVTADGVSSWVVEDVMPAPLPASAVTGSGYDSPGGVSAGAAFADIMPALHDPAERLKAQFTDSVDAEVLYGFPYLWDAIKQADDAQLRLACARAYNDWLAEFCSHAPDRLLGVGRIPTSSVEDAVSEMRRGVDELNMRGFVLDAYPDGVAGGTDPALDPIWDVAAETGLPISFHYGLGDARSAPTAGIAAGLKPPASTEVIPMASAGVFERYPNLRIALAHGDAGWSFHWLEFLDNTYLRQRHLELFKLPHDDIYPSEYFRRHVWFTVQQDRAAVTTRQMLGREHLMWASHFPLDATNYPDNRQQAIRLTEEVPDDDRQAILADNAARLYRLPGYSEVAPAPYESLQRLVHV
jgi:predicted TIM-barrel fold metal-dependent hydrolase